MPRQHIWSKQFQSSVAWQEHTLNWLIDVLIIGGVAGQTPFFSCALKFNSKSPEKKKVLMWIDSTCASSLQEIRLRLLQCVRPCLPRSRHLASVTIHHIVNLSFDLLLFVQVVYSYVDYLLRRFWKNTECTSLNANFSDHAVVHLLLPAAALPLLCRDHPGGGRPGPWQWQLPGWSLSHTLVRTKKKMQKSGTFFWANKCFQN